MTTQGPFPPDPSAGSPPARREDKGCVLVVEDDTGVRVMVAEYLEANGFVVVTATSSADAIRLFPLHSVDLVLLDLRLGRADGLDVLRTLRTASDVPVIIMTAHGSDEVDRVVGLELGADDYVLKPLKLRELLARIRVVLRRSLAAAADPRRGPDRSLFRFGRWTLSRRTRRLAAEDGIPIPLTKGEFGLLVALLESPRQILSREQLLQATRLHEDILDRSIDVQVLRLRRKLETDPAHPTIIRTERGAGYVFDLPVERVVQR